MSLPFHLSSKFAFAFSIICLAFSPSTAGATSLVGTPTQINKPTGPDYLINQVRIAADTTGKFAVIWSEDTEPDPNFLSYDVTRFKAFNANAKPIGPARKLVGTSANSPNTIGIQNTGPNKYAAFWYDKNASGRLSVFRQKFTGNVADGSSVTVFTDSDANPVTSLSLSPLTNGRSLLSRRCSCFPVTVTGQFINKAANLLPGEFQISLTNTNYLALNFRAVAGGGFVGSYLRNEDLAGQVFSSAGTKIGGVKLLPIKTDKSLIETNSMFGLAGGEILSLYGSSVPVNSTDIYARVSNGSLVGGAYTKLASKTFGMAGVALKSGDFLLAYTTSSPSSENVNIARFTPAKKLVGKPVQIKSNSAYNIRSLVALSNGNVVIAYGSSNKVFVQIVKP